jgi:hypothetical protein
VDDDVGFFNLSESSTSSIANVYFKDETPMRLSLENSLSDVKRGATTTKSTLNTRSQSLMKAEPIINNKGYITTKTLRFDDECVEFLVFNNPEVLV